MFQSEKFWYGGQWSENQWIPAVHHSGSLSEEWYEGRQNVNTKQAASASHLYGKRKDGFRGIYQFYSLGQFACHSITTSQCRFL